MICVREGKAYIEVEVYKSNKLFLKKQLMFTSMVLITNRKWNLFNSNIIKVARDALHLYAITDNQIAKENYKLKLQFEELVK